MKHPKRASATPFLSCRRYPLTCAEAPGTASPLLSCPEALGITGMNQGVIYGLKGTMTATRPPGRGGAGAEELPSRPRDFL